MANNLATTKMIQNIINATTPPQQATKAQQDGSGNNIELTYAKQNGTYPNMTVGNATNADLAAEATKAAQDGNGNNIASTYAAQTGSYPQMRVGYASDAGTADMADEAAKVTHSLTFGSKTFDGSTAQTITREDLGLGSIYTPAGSVAFADLPTPSASNVGYVYNITDAFTTDSRFLEGAGIKYPAGTNVGIIQQGSSYMFDVFGTDMDLSNYAQIDGDYPDMTVGEAGKVTNALTINFNGTQTVFDGSAARTVTISTGGAAQVDVVEITVPTSRWANRAATLTSADYAAIAHVTEGSTVQLTAADNSAATFITADINLTSQAAGSVTLTCATTPSSSVSATLIIIN